MGAAPTGRSINWEDNMRNLASLTATVLALLLGSMAVAQAGGGGSSVEYAVLECQRIPGGDFVVIMFSNHGGSAPSGIDEGDDCSEALDRLDDDDNSTDFFLQAVTSGSTDKTVYTWRAQTD
jgi:hypothetical protein